MKKFVVAVATVFVVAAVVAGGVSASGDRGGTLVASGFSCGILDGNGNIYTTTNSELWSFQNRSVLRCQGNNGVGTAPNPGPIYFNFGNTGLSCGMLQFGSTTTWSDKVGYKGDSQLTCYGPPNAVDAAASSGAGIG